MPTVADYYAEQALQKGLQQGRQEALLEGLNRFACFLLNKGALSLSEIAKETGLSLEQVEEIRHNMAQKS